MKIGIIGTGAVGGYYGGLLARSGFDVHFLLHSDYEHVRQYGLMVESKNGDFAIDAVNAYQRAEDMPACDVAIVALKTTQNGLLAHILPKMTKKRGIVVLLQNGLDVEKDVADMMPKSTVVGGLCFLCSHKAGPGFIRHLDYGSVRLGQYRSGYEAAGVTRELKLIADVFSKAGVSVVVAEDLGKARWEKLVWNMGFNGLTVVLNATTDMLMNSTATVALVKTIMMEVIGAARACGFQIPDEFADKMMTATRRMIDYSPSMKLDFAAGRPLEIDEIYWRPIEAAQRAGYSMAITRVLAYQLEFLNERLKQQALSCDEPAHLP